MSISEAQFMRSVLANPVNAELLTMLPMLGLPQCTLTAGCLFQTVWNLRCGNDAAWGVKDYDVFYFDDGDLSWGAEDAVIRRARAFLGDAGLKVEIRNQARVHLWYFEKFGKAYPRLECVEDGIDRYLISCTRLGIRVADQTLHAPDGLEDMWNGVLRMNAVNAQPDLFERKCNDYRSRWPWLTIGD
jgi:hypothetical protein